MNLQLTDVLVCPHCGPPWGLILLADDVRERRVLAGALGCANCRQRYPIRDGCADLRQPQAAAGPEESAFPAFSPENAAEEGTRLAALMGLTRIQGGRNFALVAGPRAALASSIAAIIEDLEVIAVHGAWVPLPEQPGVTHLAVRGRLPFFDRSLNGVALSGAAADALLEEGLRVLGPAGRLVLDDAPADAAARLSRSGAPLLAREGDVIVAGSVSSK